MYLHKTSKYTQIHRCHTLRIDNVVVVGKNEIVFQ